jgi:uncharacterized protein (TIGR04255 family)
MGARLKSAPVYFTVAQIQFNTILKLPEVLPTIQEGFRNLGFPDFSSQKVMALRLTVQNGQPIPSPPTLIDRFSFRNLETTNSFLLDPDKLIFQSTDYGQFETFSGVLLKGLELLHDVVRLDFTERVGLRYLDRVTPRGTDRLEDYLVPEVLGVGGRLGGLAGKTLRSFSETLHETSGTKLLSRVIIQEGGLAFPPDLLGNNMAVNKRFLDYTGRHAILDNDGFVERREPYSIDTLRLHLNGIHTLIDAAFRATATPHAFTVWEQN